MRRRLVDARVSAAVKMRHRQRRQSQKIVGPKNRGPKNSGRGGIRTPGTLRHAGFQDRCIRPLCHPSGCVVLRIFYRSRPRGAGSRAFLSLALRIRKRWRLEVGCRSYFALLRRVFLSVFRCKSSGLLHGGDFASRLPAMASENGSLQNYASFARLVPESMSILSLAMAIGV